MGGANNWPAIESGEAWMRHHEKRLLHEERRPLVRTASDLLGPGAGPKAILLQDWNSDEAAFNGIFYSNINNSLNSPDNSTYWMGQTMGNPDGFGIQHLWEFRRSSVTEPIREYVRRFFAPTAGGMRSYGPWVPLYNEGTVVRAMISSNAVQSIPQNASTVALLPTVNYAVGVGTGTANALTIQYTGIYNVSVNASFVGVAGVAGNRCLIGAMKAGTIPVVRQETSWGNSTYPFGCPSGDVRLVAGDVIQLQLYQETPAARDTGHTVHGPLTLAVRYVADSQ